MSYNNVSEWFMCECGLPGGGSRMVVMYQCKVILSDR